MSASFWDERYAAHPEFFDSPNQLLVSRFPALREAYWATERGWGTRPVRCVDLGAGQGRNACWLARQGCEVIAVDSSAVGLEHLREAAHAQNLPVSTLQADVLEWEPDSRADFVLCAFLHLPSAERPELWRRLARALAPGGVVMILGHDPSHRGHGPKDPDMLFDSEELCAAFAHAEVLERGPVYHADGACDSLLIAHCP